MGGMKANDYLRRAIGIALGGDVTVYAGRIRAGTVEPTVPCVLFRMVDGGPDAYLRMIDGFASFQRFFQIEFRASEQRVSVEMADTVLSALSSVSPEVVARYDELDDTWQKLGQRGQKDEAAGYYAHIVELSLSDEGLPDMVQARTDDVIEGFGVGRFAAGTGSLVPTPLGGFGSGAFDAPPSVTLRPVRLGGFGSGAFDAPDPVTELRVGLLPPVLNVGVTQIRGFGAGAFVASVDVADITPHAIAGFGVGRFRKILS